MGNYLCLGLLAHVDAGKTTLAEQMLYLRGSIRKPGRVDHGDAFLDTYPLERERGITIFSKQALFTLGDKKVTLLDTPGHADFFAEMERTLQVLDYAVLIVSGPDGVQGHVQTLARLLAHYQVPAFFFVNKMDQPGTDKEKILRELKNRLSEHCVDFTADAASWQEELAVCDEQTLECYLETDSVPKEEIRRLIRERKVFPCYFGSALKGDGVKALLQGLAEYTECPVYPENFAARVFKISRDASGIRLTHMKLTGGILKVKTALSEREKVDQIRLYSGVSYETVTKACAGMICAVTGLSDTHPGKGLGAQKEPQEPLLQPVLSYQAIFPAGTDAHEMLSEFRLLEEEDPLLHVLWNEEKQEIWVRVMGKIQTEVLKSLILERFGVQVDFGAGGIVYKETIQTAAEGAGHFEPLRHYAEVRLLLEPGEPGSGVALASACSTDILDLNWQRLILGALGEEEHRGVLTGAVLTDVKITLLGGRAHLKHTEGGDFRQAARRAVRQALKKAQSVLLEPVYEYRLEVPQEMVGRAMSDITKMAGSFAPPQLEDGTALLTGSLPVSETQDYQQEVLAYTRGQGHFSCFLKGYGPCHNAETVIRESGYDSETDAENPAGSVFCAHGAGFYVPWDQVEQYMHTESPLARETRRMKAPVDMAPARGAESFLERRVLDRELKEIFERTYGAEKEKREDQGAKRYTAERVLYKGQNAVKKRTEPEEEYLLVDGYNIIFAWKELKELAKENLAGARMKLQDILCNYQGCRKNTLILVFDAYKLEGGTGSVEKYHNIHVVYTKEAETADQYIEKTVRKISRKYRVTVATSDALEQIIIWGAGASRMSAAELLEEIKAASREMREQYLEKRGCATTGFFEGLAGEAAKQMEEIRLGRRTFEESGAAEDK